jgi:predicted alpha/beta hydrolase
VARAETPPAGGAAPTATDLELVAADGYRLAATRFAAAGEPRAMVLVAPAMGVPRRFYREIATYLAARGSEVLTVDYRGIGGSRPPSLRGFPARLRDWGELDLDAGLRAVRERRPELPLAYFAHSVGGQLLGLAPSAPAVERALFVASQSGWEGNWDGNWRWRMRGLWRVMIPVATAIFGHLPGRLGIGQDVPKRVAREWAWWGRHPEYLLRDGGAARRQAYAALGFPLRAVAIADDNYAPERSVRALVGFYAGTRSEVHVVEPSDLGRRRLGHFAPFRRDPGEALWPTWAEWLLGSQ